MKLNRFSADKQDLIEQFVEYAQLMGLSGKDLMAIGGKLERDSKKEIKKANMAIVKSFECLTIGADAKWQLDDRFKLKTTTGAYNFQYLNWGRWEIVSLKTKVKQSHRADPYDYDLPRIEHQTRSRYALLLDIAAGKLQLNF